MRWLARTLVIVMLAAGLAAAAGDLASGTIVGWRGDGSGQYPRADPPVKWSGETGIVWQAEVGTGTSSPVVAGARVFVTAEPDVLFCLDADTGKELWRKGHKLSDFPAAAEPKHPLRAAEYGNANPTPVSDGSRVWVVFGTGIVACYRVDGEKQWANWFDVEQTTDYARTASPVLVAGRLLVHLGPLICLDAASGKLLWQNDDTPATYGTPASARVGGVDVIITPAGHVVRLNDGKTLASEVGRCAYTSPIVLGGTVYFVDTSVSAAELTPTADGVKSKELWYKDLGGELFASPVVHQGGIYAVNRDAILYVIDAKTGKLVVERTLELPPAGRTESPNIYPSLCLAGDRLFIANDAGECLVMEGAPKGGVTGINTLRAGSGATPAFDGGRMFFRGGKLLWRIDGEKARGKTRANP